MRRLALSYHSVRVQGSFCVRKASHGELREAADVENFRNALGAWCMRRTGHVQHYLELALQEQRIPSSGSAVPRLTPSFSAA
jgi:hypothetical protein